jgi:sporulation protein YlmC with PRC-barrel domain
VLRSVRELQTYKTATAEGSSFGRIKDVYFDDGSWKITHLLISAGTHKQVLIPREEFSRISAEQGVVQLRLNAAELQALPLPNSVMPVCKQYAALSLSSPRTTFLAGRLAAASPNLRSAKVVLGYSINANGVFSGTLEDLICDDETLEIRYLAIGHSMDGKKLRFHVVPQSVERFTWSTQRVIMRELQPVRMDAGDREPGISAAA